MLNLAGIVPESIVDGPGLRTTVFCQGCPHHCRGCQNPETWEFGAGTDTDIRDILDVVRRDPLVHGVTLSGGEPFAQAAELVHLTRQLKAEGYEVAAYTGYTLEQLLEDGTDSQRELLSLLDVLIDGPFVLAERSLELNFRGSRNQRVLNAPDSVRAGRAVMETSLRWLGKY